MLKRILSTLLAAVLAAGTLLPASAAIAPAASGEVNNYTSTCEWIDKNFGYDGKLGADYSAASTTFRVWAPKATKVTLKRYATGSDSEQGAASLGNTAMTQDTSSGVWSVKIDGDLVNTYYTYEVTTTDVMGKDLQTYETQDPYSYAVGVNGDRTMVVDLDKTDPSGWSSDKHVLLSSPTDSFVWEVHIKDFSYDESSGVSEKNRGKYLAFTETGTTLNGKGGLPTCIDYLKSLGVTTVQINPFSDFSSVDETGSDTQFNWGYDPKNYSVPEGSYSSNPYDGNVRINECKQMIQALHNAGISVVMDVVYNHTNGTGIYSCFDSTLPKYYYRMWHERNDDWSVYYDSYVYSNGSGCGNETASERRMYQKYMVDSITYWANEYHIDGFRFDLMALHDVETLNRIRSELDKIDSRITMWGEGWTGGGGEYPGLTWDEKTFQQAFEWDHPGLDERIGFFNDGLRDSLRADNDFNKPGWIQTPNDSNNFNVSIGMKAENQTYFNSPTQVVSYAACHDNRTLWDQLCASQGLTGSYYKRDDKIAAETRLAGAILSLSQGATFVLAGEEMGRSKGGEHNSYNKPPEINKIDWNLEATNIDIVSYYRGLRKIRENFDLFTESRRTSSNYNFLDIGTDKNLLACVCTNTNTSQWKKLLFVANSSDYDVTYQIPSGNDQNWIVISDGSRAGLDKLGEISGGKVSVPANSAVIAVDTSSFGSVSVENDMCTLNVSFINEATGEVVKNYVTSGVKGTNYGLYAPDVYDYNYILDKIDTPVTGIFSESKDVKAYYVRVNAGTVSVNYYKTGTTTKVRESDVYSAVVGDTITLDAPPPLLGYELNAEQTMPSNVIPVVYGNTDVNYYYDETSRTVKLHLRHSSKSHTWAPTVYVWGESGTEYGTAKKWPGDTLSTADSNGWFNMSFATSATEKAINIIVHSNGGGYQTVDNKNLADNELWIIIDDDKLWYGTENLTFYTEDPDTVSSPAVAARYGNIGYSFNDIEPTLYPITKDDYITATVSGCEADKTIAGAEVILTVDKSRLPEGKSVDDIKINGGAVSYRTESNGSLVFKMPAGEAVITAETVEKTTYEINLYDFTGAVVPEEVMKEILKLPGYSAENKTFDFNSDGEPDVLCTPAENKIERLGGADKLSDNYSISFGSSNESALYSGVLFRMTESFVLNFTANGGSGTMPSVSVKAKEIYTLPECTFTPPAGKAFDYWLAGTERHNPGDELYIESDLTITPQWKTGSITLTFDANGGSGTMKSITTDAGEYTLPPCGFTSPESSIFKGWTVGEQTYNPSALVSFDADTTIKAAWVKLTHYEAVEAECERDGNIEYYLGDDGVIYSDAVGSKMPDMNGDGKVDENDYTVTATGHSWEDPVWTWYGTDSARATFTCHNDASHVKSVEASVASSEELDMYGAVQKIVYTATVEFEDSVYTDVKETTVSGSDIDKPSDSDTPSDSDIPGGDSDIPRDSDSDTPGGDKPGNISGLFLGDLDDDGEITSSDALIILRASLGMTTLDTDHARRADVDGDGDVTSADALAVLRFSVGFPSDYKIGERMPQN